MVKRKGDNTVSKFVQRRVVNALTERTREYNALGQLFIATAGEVLFEKYGFTQEMLVEWAKETIDRMSAKLASKQTSKN